MSNSRFSVIRERRKDIGPQAKKGGKEESEPVCQFSQKKPANSKRAMR